MDRLHFLSYKTLFIIFFLALAGIIFFLKIGGKTTNVSAAWWNGAWRYRRSITITNSTGATQTNVLIKVLENYNLSSLVSAGKLKSDLSDLRFTTNAQISMNYWIEDATSSSADIWVVIPSLPTSGTTIWMYYGNSAATNASISPFSYSGSSQIISNSNGVFHIRILSNGAFTPAANMSVKVFLVGGGGGSAYNASASNFSIILASAVFLAAYESSSGGGSGGGYTTTGNVSLSIGTTYTTVVGAGGLTSISGNRGVTSQFAGLSAAGGYPNSGNNGGNGGSGGGFGGPWYDAGGYFCCAGPGASDGANAGGNCASGGTGQGTTTREFAESGNTLYAGGGGGFGGYYTPCGGNWQSGGAGGGGAAGASGTANTGGGGGGQASGGSGIIVIRYTNPSSTSTLGTEEESHAPNTPTLDLPANGAVNQSFLPTLKTTSTDVDGDYLRYRIEICQNQAMTISCQTIDQTSSQTGWSGQNAATGTAYTSGTQASYTFQNELSSNTTYYWRSYAVDPDGSNLWSNTQANPFSFTTIKYPNPASRCLIEESLIDNQLSVTWSDNADNEDGYSIQKNINNTGWNLLINKGPNITSHIDTAISKNNTYQYRIAPYSGVLYAGWCYTPMLNLGQGNFNFEGINLDGVNLD